MAAKITDKELHQSLLDTLYKNYLWKETKTVAAGSNILTLTNTPSSTNELLIRDLNWGAFWDKNIHWTIQDNVITFTSPMPEDFTFLILNLG